MSCQRTSACFPGWFPVSLYLLISLVIPAEALGQSEIRRTERVIVITLDGLRWQELFGGADDRLLNEEFGDVRDVDELRSRYWHHNPVRRRHLLMPFFWSVIAEDGQVFGDPDSGSTARVENGRFFSYPGYNEILTGIADHSIDSNDKKHNQNVTVLEWLNRMPAYRGSVQAFASWDVFPFIINAPRSGIPVDAGWPSLREAAPSSPTAELAAVRALAQELPRVWASVRYDCLTIREAMHCLRHKRPKVLYVALGETDDWCHEGRYDLYLDAARRSDDYIRQIWETAQSLPEYQGRTALVITTDHGRGDDRIGWKSHKDSIAGSEQIWAAAMVPDLAAVGLRKDIHVVQGQFAATVAELLGHDFTSTHEKIRQPLPLIRRPQKEQQPDP